MKRHGEIHDFRPGALGKVLGVLAKNRIIIASIVCSVHAMPHAKVTHNLFWLGIAPHQPPILKNYLNTVQPGSANAC